MTYKEALNYINGTLWLGSKPGLKRIRELCSALGDPQDSLKFVHIAGTNGKGSAAAMTASVLKAAGYRTGLFTSPYLYRFNERMQINGEQIPDEVLADIVARIKPAAEKMEDHPTEFEMMTAAAFLWFRQERCDIVVLEVGLGGRLDSTNIIAFPECAVIMNIGLDHTKILGDTVEAIAREKAGIIKPGCDVCLYEQKKTVEEIISSICKEKGADLTVADFSSIKSEFDSTEGQAFFYKGREYSLPLLGKHQLKNAAVVIETVGILRKRGYDISDLALEHGLYSVRWPARFEIISDDPYFVVDGGHNPQCAETVRENTLAYFPGMRHIFLTGVMADKDYPALFDILNEAADEFVCVTPSNPRALRAEELAAFLRKYQKPVHVCDTVQDGVEKAKELALESNGAVIATGSLYMSGDIRACFGLF